MAQEGRRDLATDEIVVSIETDKVRIDVRSPTSGTIKKTLVPVESDVRVGQELFEVTPGAVESAAPKDAPKPAAPKEESKPALPKDAPKSTAPKEEPKVLHPKKPLNLLHPKKTQNPPL